MSLTPTLTLRAAATLGVAAVAVLVGACSSNSDDGAKVREGPGRTASGEASAPASGSGSGPEAGSGGSDPAPCNATGFSTGPPAATVEARLSAFVVEAIPANVPAGPVDVVAVNMGFEEHEVMLLRYDGDPADLPVRPDGRLDEGSLPKGTVVGRSSRSPARARARRR